MDIDILTLFICIRLKYRAGIENLTNEGFPTTVKLDFFSGYTFVGITEAFGKPNSFVGWKTESRYNFALIHLKKVGWNCGVCFNVQYKRQSIVQRLAPAQVSAFS